MTLSRIQFEMAIDRLCQECVYAYVHRREPFCSLGRDMAISNVIAFYDELVERKRSL